MKILYVLCLLCCASSLLVSCDKDEDSPKVITGSGNIQSAIDEYRALLGGTNNGNAVGSQQDGRRELNWDGVPDESAAPNYLAADFSWDAARYLPHLEMVYRLVQMRAIQLIHCRPLETLIRNTKIPFHPSVRSVYFLPLAVMWLICDFMFPAQTHRQW